MGALLEHLSERGVISWDQGHWQIGVSLKEIDVGVPDCLRKTIEAQIDRLTSEERRVLEAASLSSIGRTRFGVASRSAVIEMDADQFEEVCEALSRRHGILRSAAADKLTNGAISAHALRSNAFFKSIRVTATTVTSENIMRKRRCKSSPGA